MTNYEIWLYKKAQEGGGGGTSILSGSTDPASAQGNNGQIYLKYSDLPNDYTFKEYLEVGSTAGAYINTNLKIATTHEFEVKLQMYGSQNADTIHFGRWISNKDTMIFFNNGSIGFNVGGVNTSPYSTFDNNVHIFKATQSELLIDNVVTSLIPKWSNVPTNENYYMFKEPNHNGVINSRIYYVKIWNNGTLIRDFIPAERNSDNEIGMFDIVNGVFYTNSGTGSFTVGDTITPTVGKPINNAFAKVNGSWQNLIGTDIDDIGGRND